MPFYYETAFALEEMCLFILLFLECQLFIEHFCLFLIDFREYKKILKKKKKILRHSPCSPKVSIYLEILLLTS